MVIDRRAAAEDERAVPAAAMLDDVVHEHRGRALEQDLLDAPRLLADCWATKPGGRG